MKTKVSELIAEEGQYTLYTAIPKSGSVPLSVNKNTTVSFATAFSLIQGMPASLTNGMPDGNTDPLFVDTANNDYRLRFDSPCINKGHNDSIPYGNTTDLNGNDRIAYDTVDMGAYEYKLTLDLGNDTSICNNTGFTLNSDNAGSSYLWSTGDTTQSIVADNSGTYYVSVSNSWGTVTDTIHVNIGMPPVVNLGNDITTGAPIITLDAGNSGATYLWNTGSTAQTIAVSTNGIYSVAVTNEAGCSASDTIKVTFQPNGINELNANKNTVSISPNPPQEAIHISFTDEKLLHTNAILTDTYGRTVREVMLNRKSQQLSMAGLSPGVYILKTITGNSIKIIKE